MTERVLEDAARLGAALADTASKQIESVLKELRRPSAPGAAGTRLGMETLAASALQIASKLGALMVEASKFDLVRRNDLTFRVGAPNSVASLPFDPGSEVSYPFWVENDGRQSIRVRARLGRGKTGITFEPLAIEPDLGVIAADERRRAHVKIPKDVTDARILVFEAYLPGATQDDVQIVRQRTVTLNADAGQIVDPGDLA